MINKSVKVLTGKYAGLAGIVERMGENGAAMVRIEGVANGVLIYATVWLKAAQMEAL